MRAERFSYRTCYEISRELFKCLISLISVIEFFFIFLILLFKITLALSLVGHSDIVEASPTLASMSTNVVLADGCFRVRNELLKCLRFSVDH